MIHMHVIVGEALIFQIRPKPTCKCTTRRAGRRHTQMTPYKLIQSGSLPFSAIEKHMPVGHSYSSTSEPALPTLVFHWIYKNRQYNVS